MHAAMIGRTQTVVKVKIRKKVYALQKRNIFEAVNTAALGRIDSLARGWLVKPRKSGDNLFGLNPTRHDRSVGSFCINIRTGIWGDFATGDKGGDIVSFYAYLHGLSQIDAARELARQLGVDHD